MKTDAERFAEMLGDVEPVSKAGRPTAELAPDFDSALAALKPLEAQFVRHVLAGADHAAAYGKTHSAANERTRRVKGQSVAKRKQVAHALALGRKAGALQAITGLKFDLQQAHAEICGQIAAAAKENQFSAVAQLLKLKAAIWKLDQPVAQQAQGVQIILQSADGVEIKSFGSVPQQQPIEGEEIEHE